MPRPDKRQVVGWTPPGASTQENSMPNTNHTETTGPTGWRANHIEETIRSVARLHAEHHENATPLQRAADRITALLGRPRWTISRFGQSNIPTHRLIRSSVVPRPTV